MRLRLLDAGAVEIELEEASPFDRTVQVQRSVTLRRVTHVPAGSYKFLLCADSGTLVGFAGQSRGMQDSW